MKAPSGAPWPGQIRPILSYFERNKKRRGAHTHQTVFFERIEDEGAGSGCPASDLSSHYLLVRSFTAVPSSATSLHTIIRHYRLHTSDKCHVLNMTNVTSVSVSLDYNITITSVEDSMTEKITNVEWSEYQSKHSVDGVIKTDRRDCYIDITIWNDGDVEIEKNNGWNTVSEKVIMTVEQMREIVRKADEWKNG